MPTPCACYVRDHDQQNEPEIVYCPVHAAAPEMLVLLHRVDAAHLGSGRLDPADAAELRALLRAVEGEP